MLHIIKQLDGEYMSELIKRGDAQMKQKLLMGLVIAMFIFGMALSGSTVHGYELINFDSLQNNTQVGNKFQSIGIIFDAPGFQALNYTFDAIIIPSLYNYAHLSTTSTTIYFVDPLNQMNPATTSFFEFDNPGLLWGGGFLAGFNVVARSLNGSIIDTAQILPAGHYQYRDIFKTRLEGSGIHSIEFIKIANSNGGAIAPIDNVLFAEVTPVPIPGAIWLLGSGIVGLVGLQRRRGIRRRSQNMISEK
jgi:hypothetical protein